MGKTTYKRLKEIFDELKARGIERTTEKETIPLIVMKIGSTKRTFENVDFCLKNSNLVEDEGNGVYRIL